MPAYMMQLLDELENRLEHAQGVIASLEADNRRLAEQLAASAPDEQAVKAPDLSLEEPSLEEPSQEESSQEEPSQPSSAPPVQLTLPSTGPQDASLAPSPPATQDAEPESASSVSSSTDSSSSDSSSPVSSNPTVQDAQPTPPSPHQLLSQWYARYPKAFSKGRTQPLKIGIHQDLAEREPWSNKLIRRALANYVNLPRYIKAMREGAERVDLEGNPAGVVDVQAAELAAQKRQATQRTQSPQGADAQARAGQQPAGQPGLGKPGSGNQGSGNQGSGNQGPGKRSSSQGAENKPSGKRPGSGRRARPGKQNGPGKLHEKASESAKNAPQSSGEQRQPLSLEEKLASLQAKFQAR